MHDVFYFTDIHGMYDLYRAIMDYCLTQDPECTIIFGGDAIDRGPDGYKIMKELIANPQVTYLKGNHEDMFVQAAERIYDDYKGKLTGELIKNYLYNRMYDDQVISLSIQNGGFNTLYDWMLDGMSMDLIMRLKLLPLAEQYRNLDFCHACGDPKIYKRVIRNEYNGIPVSSDNTDMMIWDRNWLGFGWAPDRICVFGHTPSFHLPAKYYGQDKSTFHAHPCKYVGMIDNRLTGYRISMDTGAAISGRAYVLNCNTMQAIGFRDMDFENEEIHKHNIEKIEVIQF